MEELGAKKENYEEILDSVSSLNFVIMHKYILALNKLIHPS